MRVHPVQLRTAGSGWQIPLILILLAVVFASQLFTKDKPQADARPLTETQSVVVATRNLNADEELTVAVITVAERPVSTIPKDAVTTIDAALGRFARGPIPAGYPISSYLLREAEGIAPQKAEPKHSQQKKQKRRGTEA